MKLCRLLTVFRLKKLPVSFFHNAESQYLAQLRIYVHSVREEKGPLLDMTCVDVDDCEGVIILDKN
jgi:hypothetical protein